MEYTGLSGVKAAWNYKSDFAIDLQLILNGEVQDLPAGVPFVVTVTGNMGTFEARYNGQNGKGCAVDEDGKTIHVYVNNHHLGIGRLTVDVWLKFEDANYPQGKDIHLIDRTSFALVRGNGQTDAVTVEMALPFAIVTAYDVARSKGYQGTQEEFYNSLATVTTATDDARAATAEANAATAEAKKAGEEAKNTATQATTDAATQIAAMKSDAADQIASLKSDAESKIAESKALADSAVNTANAATAKANNASKAADSAVKEAEQAISDVTAKGTTVQNIGSSVQQAEKKRVEAEEVRVKNENARIIAEDARQTDTENAINTCIQVYNSANSAVTAAKEGAEKAETAATAANTQATAAENAAENAENIYTTVKEAYESGAFKGEKGDKGDKGDQGAQGIQGAQGAKGDKGESGGFLPVVEHSGTETNVSITPRTSHVWTETFSTLTATFGEVTDTTTEAEIRITFNTGSSTPTIALPDSVVWSASLSLEASKRVEMSFVWGNEKWYGVYALYDI